MIAGIDLGCEATKIAYRQDGIWHYCTRPPYIPEDAYKEKSLINYLTSLLSDAAFRPMASVGISYPHYWGMSRRRTLFKACQVAFAGQTFHLLPGPAAALMGSESTRSLSGDILIIEVQESTASFSLLTVAEAGKDICLEAQLPLELSQPLQSAFDNFISNILQPRAEHLGFFEAGSWRLDDVILIGEESWLRQVLPLISNCFSSPDLIVPQLADFQIARGLIEWAALESQRPRVKAIYPFQFLQEAFRRDMIETEFTPLPFDTNNLALDLEGRYLITTLTSGSLLNLSADPHTVHYRLWERPTCPKTNNGEQTDNYLIWEYQNLMANSPEPLGVYFNTEEFIIESGGVGQVGLDRSVLYNLDHDYQKSAQRLLSIPFINTSLKNDLQAADDQPTGYDLPEQLEATRLRLLTLLQLFSLSDTK